MHTSAVAYGKPFGRPSIPRYILLRNFRRASSREVKRLPFVADNARASLFSFDVTVPYLRIRSLSSDSFIFIFCTISRSSRRISRHGRLHLKHPLIAVTSALRPRRPPDSRCVVVKSLARFPIDSRLPKQHHRASAPLLHHAIVQPHALSFSQRTIARYGFDSPHASL